MVKARIAPNNKICLVYDSIQKTSWTNIGRCNEEGIGDLLKVFLNAGFQFDDISVLCLSDVWGKAKAKDYADKKEYVDEVINTCGFPVIVPIGAESFTKMVGFKGMQKWVGRPLYSEVYPTQKVICMPSILQAKYDPRVLDTIKDTATVIKQECEFNHVVEKPKQKLNHFVIDSISNFDKLMDYYLSGKISYFTVDTETKGFNAYKGELLTIQLSHAPTYSYLIQAPFYGVWSDSEWNHIKARLKELFSRTDITCVGHNLKYDLKWLHVHADIPLRKHNIYDTMCASFVSDETKPNGLKENVIDICPEIGDYEFEMVRWIDNYCAKSKPKIKKKNFTYDLIPFDLLKDYALMDTDATARLYLYYQQKVKEEAQEEVLAMLHRFTYLLLVWETTGWPINKNYCIQYQQELKERIAALEAELFETKPIKLASAIKYKRDLEKENLKRKNPITELKKFEFKLGSNPNKQLIFFDLLKLPVIKKTKTGGKATDKAVLEEWVVRFPQHAEFLLKYREWGNLSKLKSTYIDAFIREEHNGRIYPTYSVTKARSGRTASSGPNLQNIPVHSKEGKRVKQAFEAGEGKVLSGADLQACEMRLCAVYSLDPNLISIFLNNLDIHGKVCKDIFPYVDCEINEVKSKFPFERNDVSKKVGFGSIYRISARGLARNINAGLITQWKDGKITGEEFEKLRYTEEKAQAVLDAFFTAYSGIDQYLKDTEEFIEKHGYSLSLFGRKRRVPGVFSKDEYVRAEAIRQASNSPIQSSGSDCLLISACNYLDEIEERNLPIKLLGGVHDALYQEIPEEHKAEYSNLMVEHLKFMAIPNSPVPMEADAEWGKNWNSFSDDFGVGFIEDEDDETDDEDEEDIAA